MRSPRTLLAPAALMVLAATAFAVTLPGSSAEFAVDVSPSISRVSGDSIRITYVVRVAPDATDSLTSFAVDAPAGGAVVTPPPPADWLAIDHMRLRPIAKWVPLDRLFGAGQSTPELTLIGRGIAGIVPFWAARKAPLDSVVTDNPADASPVYDTLIVVNGQTGRTTGIVPIPSGSTPVTLAIRLASLVNQACALNWIDNAGICNSLRAKARAEAGPLGALISELDAQRGKHVNGAAYALLTDNAMFILSRLR